MNRVICYLCHDFNTWGTADACRRCLALLERCQRETLGRSTAQDSDDSEEEIRSDDGFELDPQVECGPYNPARAIVADGVVLCLRGAAWGKPCPKTAGHEGACINA